MESSGEYLFEYKGCYFVKTLTTPEYLDTLEDFEIRESDVFLVTYPKSGTVWTQNILSLIYHEGHRNGTEEEDMLDRVPWLEYKFRDIDYVNRTSPRLFASHLPYYLMPKGLRNGRTKVIYVARNPKDALVSYYHYSKINIHIKDAQDFEILMERFLAGKMPASLWLDHIEGWSAHRDDFNIIFLTYEEMKKDLKRSVLKICSFLGKSLAEKEVNDVVDKASFDKMREDPRANYETMALDVLHNNKGHFLRKGTIGDWKNVMTVAQSERFDSIFKQRMEKLPFKFCWDIKDEFASQFMARPYKRLVWDYFSILFLTYEEMKKDLRSSVLKLCKFLGKSLAEKEVYDIVDNASFDKMRMDLRTNYETIMAPDILDNTKVHFLLKGTTGDWKNIMTIAQSERFDSIFKERMEKLPFKFCWDIKDEL